jgi:hypothetical protein
MKNRKKIFNSILLVIGILSIPVTIAMGGDVCKGFPPQAPRDIDNIAGENTSIFSLSPSYKEMNLCNLHFHVNAEHKAKDFSIYAGDGVNGLGGGYQCNDTKSLSQSELQAPKTNFCKDVKPGDTIEVHWVYTSCETTPGKSLNSCFSDACINPNLRVESKVFLVVNDASALNFMDFAYGGNIVDGYHQAKSLPTNTGKPVEYVGSTTGPTYTEQKCSPFQGTWSVRSNCAKVDINSLSEWCKDNVFEENHAHGVRELVTHPKLLGEIK